MNKDKILIVEDDENVRFLYEQELIDEGYLTVIAMDGRDCLEKIKTESPDIVVLDIKMPVMDGMEAIKRIAEIDRDLPVIINSAYTGYKNDFISWVADAYVQKSCDLSALKSSIKLALENNRLKSRQSTTERTALS
jgi:two-component system, response regulator, stage 0 sporulation protein F